jgi:hypothetical protein
MEFDPRRGVTVMFGGIDLNYDPTADVWEWNGTAWTQRTTTGTVLTARSEHSASYDTLRDTTVFFGGIDTNYDPSGQTWEFGAPCTLVPVITTQPTAQTACPGGTATLLVTATTNGPASYRWRRNGVLISANANPSAITPSLVVSNVQVANFGSYDCFVSNTCAAVATNSVSLTAGTCACSRADLAGAGSSGLEPDGVVDGSDYIAFINSFGAGDRGIDATADIAGAGPNNDQPDGVIDGTDFIVFLNAYAAGC